MTRDTDIETDILVLGGGPGGYTAAFRAADLGRSVTLIEQSPTLGGVCLNVGCIPSKTLLHTAKVIEDARHMAVAGLRFATPEIELSELRTWKDSIVKKLTDGLSGLAKQRKVNVITGSGTFLSPHEMIVATADGSKTVRFEKAIVATGSSPAKLPLVPQDDSRVLDSTGALELQDIPEHLLVIGGGIIGLEMATVYCALGSRVTVVEIADQIIPEADRDLATALMKHLSSRFEAIHLKTKVTQVESCNEGLKAAYDGADNSGSGTFDKILVAVGRRPNSSALNLSSAGVAVDDHGFIPVDQQMRTNVPHIFAIGDIVGPPMLAHKATYEAKVAAEVAAGRNAAFDARVIPSVAYTDPELAWVGLTESEAKEKAIPYNQARFPWAASGRALSLGRDEGFTKVLFDPESHRLLGCGIVGPNAGDLIAEATLALEMGADAADVAGTIHPHPTLSETLAMAAEMFEGTITDLMPPRQRSS